jgi:hypothetical protein
MNSRLFVGILLVTILGGFLPGFAAEVKKGTAKFEVQLLWGTDLEKSPDATHKAVQPDVERKLKSLPLRFKNYFLVNQHTVDIATSETKKVKISEKCALELESKDNLKFETTFYGKGKQTAKRIQAFPLGEMLVHGGNAPGSNAWLVVVKRVK